jgi:hypothetical protein
MKWPAALLIAPALFAADLPKITYSRSFPKSTPAYFEISVDKSGRATYKEAADEENPLAFQLKPEETAAIFGLAEKLGYFSRPLESNLKVAKTGVKTFRYTDGAKKSEVQFNYSIDAEAQALQDWFERIAETEQRYIELERAVKYDKLGVNDALLQLEITIDHKRLVAPDQFLPLLDRVAKNESYLHIARERAAKLAEGLRAPAAATQQ